MLTAEQARVLITTSLTDDGLEDVIAREEAWLARRIGPLDGERTETFPEAYFETGEEVLRLRRPTDAVTVEDDGGEVTVSLRGWADVIRDDGAWSGDAVATYTPNDEVEVERALITLVRLALTESGYTGETSGVHAYQSDGQERSRQRWAAWHSLLRAPEPTSVRIVSTISPGPGELRSGATALTGS